MNALAEPATQMNWTGVHDDTLRRLATVSARVISAVLPVDEFARVEALAALAELPLPVRDHLNEPVVALDSQGTVLQANPAADRFFRSRWPEEEILRLIALARSGELPLPAKVSGNLPSLLGSNLPIWMVARNRIVGGTDRAAASPDRYWLVAPRTRPTASDTAEDRTFSALIGDEIRSDIARLRGLLQAFDARSAVVAEAIDLALELDRTLGQLAWMAADQQLSAPHKDERLFVNDLLREVVARIAQGDPSGAARIRIWSVGDEIAPIYGKSGWLKRAIESVLTGLLEGNPEIGILDVGIQQVGNLVVVSGRHVDDIVSAVPPASRNDSRRSAVPAILQAHVARHIFEMHGGHLQGHVRTGADPENSGDAITAFTLSLPTGTSMLGERSDAICANCPMARQAHRYAADLATLLARS